MFDHYLGTQGHDPRYQSRQRIALMLASASITALFTLSWAMSAMSIARVSPPSASSLIVALSSVVPPPPPPPPPPPAGGGEQAPEEMDDGLPDQVVPLERAAKAPRQPGPPVLGGERNGKVGGVPGGPGVALCPGCIGTVPIKRRTPEGDRPGREMAAIDVVRARARYSPNPSAQAISRLLGPGQRRSGTNETAFCVGVSGRVSEVKTSQSFEPAVDALCRDTVRKWRFDPLKVDGSARKTCTVVTFDIRVAP